MTRMKRYFHTCCLWVLILFLFGVSLAMGQDSPIKTGLDEDLARQRVTIDEQKNLCDSVYQVRMRHVWHRPHSHFPG